jgi:hypothetical protein
MRILAYAPASGQAGAVAAVAKRVEGWVKEWALTVEDTRALYLALASTFAGTQDHLTFLLKYLNTFEARSVLDPTCSSSLGDVHQGRHLGV